jgi:hypothetical protein
VRRTSRVPAVLPVRRRRRAVQMRDRRLANHHVAGGAAGRIGGAGPAVRRAHRGRVGRVAPVARLAPEGRLAAVGPEVAAGQLVDAVRGDRGRTDSRGTRNVSLTKARRRCW